MHWNVLVSCDGLLCFLTLVPLGPWTPWKFVNLREKKGFENRSLKVLDVYTFCAGIEIESSLDIFITFNFDFIGTFFMLKFSQVTDLELCFKLCCVGSLNLREMSLFILLEIHPFILCNHLSSSGSRRGWSLSQCMWRQTNIPSHPHLRQFRVSN